MFIRFGDKGDVVQELQIILGDLKPDGIFGRYTEAAVKNYQIKNGLHPSGIVTPEMYAMLFKVELSTDAEERFNASPEPFEIKKFPLPSGEFVEEVTKKDYIFLHHTAGNHNPYDTIVDWKNDNRGRIGTHYVIGGLGTNGDDTYDGVIVQAIPEQYWAYHLGRVDQYMHSHSIGIEICSRGWLIQKYGKFYDWTGRIMPPEYVYSLSKPFNGYQHYHKYSDKQIVALKQLVEFLADKHKIDLTIGLHKWLNQYDPHEAFSYWTEAMVGSVRGLLSHTNVRIDKTDIYPDKKIVKFIKDFERKL